MFVEAGLVGAHVVRTCHDGSDALNRSFTTTKRILVPMLTESTGVNHYSPLYWRKDILISLDVNLVPIYRDGSTKPFTQFVIEKFDMTVCCIGLDPSGLTLTSVFLEDCSQSRLRYVAS